MIFLRCLLCLLLFLTPLCFATEDFYPFTSSLQQQRFEKLTGELRCLVCQNQNLAESNAGLAVDLRNEVYKQILQGRSDQQIITYLVARYGDFILYHPPFNRATSGLWLAPFLLLFFGVGYLFFYIKRKEGSH